MGTEFDRLRGSRSGRIAPINIGADRIDGSYLFALGVDGDWSGQLSDSDFSEVQQKLDLTGVDLVTARLFTRGRVLEPYQASSGWFTYSDNLFLFRFDEERLDSGNWQRPGFDLRPEGDLGRSVETYSPEHSPCRVVPVNSTTARMVSTNAPQFHTSDLDAYTFQFWLNFLSESHPTSDGVDVVLFRCVSAGVGGLEIGLKGATGVGAHAWSFYVRHVNGATDETRYFLSHVIDTNTGWKLYSIVFDSTLVGVAKLKLYVDGALACSVSVAPTVSPAAANLGESIQVVDPNAWGQFDQLRLSQIARDASNILADFVACTTLPPAVNFRWVMEIVVGTILGGFTIVVQRDVEPDESREWIDFVAPVKWFDGLQTVKFRLIVREV
jgi:hypothetical protein